MCKTLDAFGLCLTACLVVAGWSTPAYGAAPFAEAAYVPPSAVKAASPLAAPLPPDELAACVAQRTSFHVFREFEGATKALQEEAGQAKDGPLEAGRVVEISITGEALLGAPVKSGTETVYVAAVISIDAEALKLRLDLSALQPGEEAWVVDPISLTSFGPYTASSRGAGRIWAAYIQGDEVALLVKTPYETTPQVGLTGYSHFYLSLREAAKAGETLSCEINIACETDPGTLEISSGVGYVITTDDYDPLRAWYCSGTLINNGLTPELEPFFITANHCICSGWQTRNTEIIWDYRATACGGDGPDRDSLMLRSFGEKLLATNADLDMTLIKLDFVQVGPYGRTYVGWDSRLLEVEEDVKCIHHPNTTHMRISKGTVRTINEDKNGWVNQTRVHWDEGVTEGGSSGSCLLLDNPTENNRIVGTLSQGPTHSCTTNINNLDWFGSFHDFFPEIQAYIESNPPSTAEGDDDCRDVHTDCALSQAYAAAPAVLEGFRAIRDRALMPTAAGRRLVTAYYDSTPVLGPAVAHSPVVRGAVLAATAPFARAGMLLKLLPAPASHASKP